MDNLNENLNETELGSHPFISWNPKYSYPPTAIHVKKKILTANLYHSKTKNSYWNKISNYKTHTKM